MSAINIFSCLVVDDDQGFVSILSKVVRQEGGEPTCCASLTAARAEIERRSFDLILLDNWLPEGTGYDFFPQVNRRSPSSLVVMITGVPELAQAVELTRNGLFDYLTKPLNMEDFIACLRRVKQRLSHPDPAEGPQELAGETPAIREVIHSLKQIARHPSTTVLLTGETGTGKDLAARMIHRLTHAGSQTAPAYVPLNCSAVPSEMFESELFGSEKGAFTGAEKRRAGLIEAAEGGTLFLDEITETPLPQQAKLLRFLESREYRTLGSTHLREFTGRIVAATNRSLEQEVRSGRFRQDLLFRLNVAAVNLPPLRDHIADLETLTHLLLSNLAKKYGRPKPLLREADALALRGYHFPGNVRELHNLLERAMLRTHQDSAWLEFDREWLSHPAADAAASIRLASPPPAYVPNRRLNAVDLQEYRLIQQALRDESGGIRRAAGRLGITHQALLRRLEKWPELRVINSKVS
jgi:DNA-binding NtrC family response regulator